MSKFAEALEVLKGIPSDNSEHLQTIHDAVVRTLARIVLELGVGYGRSTVAILAGLEKTGGRLVSLDVLDYPGTRENYKAPNWTFEVGNDLEIGETWSEPIDVLLIDSSHEREHTEKELRLFGPFVRPGGVVLLHDTVSHPAVLEAIRAWIDPGEWTLTHHENNNGLAVIEKVRRKVCRYAGTRPGGLASTSGPTVLGAAISECLSGDERFAPIDGTESGANDVIWIPTYADTARLMQAIRAGRRVAIGPNVVFANSRAPGSALHEKEILAYENYAAIFFLSRWYSELARLHFKQQHGHVLLDFPLPATWTREPWTAKIEADALIYVKGGAVENAIADQLAARFPNHVRIDYGAYERGQFLDAARTSRVCFYLSHEDHYPLASVELGLMGCPIVSDEKSCPVLIHRVTGIARPVRERDTESPFAWSDYAASDLASAWYGAVALDREQVRETTLRRHDPGVCVERIANALGVC